MVNATEIEVRPAVPWWYWAIAVLGVLWSLGGAGDYVMVQTRNADYLAEYPAEVLAFMESLPSWLEFFWAIAVWGGLLGWALMLLRSRWAIPVFVASLAAMVVNFGYMAAKGGLALQAEHQGAMAYLFTALIFAGAIFAIWYSRKMRARGILR